VSGNADSVERVPSDAENLAARAAEAWAASRGEALGIGIAIDKRVPVAAGLGGGSADAAATLAALDELRDGSVSQARELAAELGSDVPALLAGLPVLARGRGELVTPVHAATTWWVLKPFDFPVTASDAYRWWDDEPSTGPDAGVLIAALETGDVELLGDALFNDLQAPVAARHPEVAGAIHAMLDAGALGAVMSGSGPTVTALARHVGHADSLASAVEGAIVVSGPPESHHRDEG
jgi:4-diphosphocytidyl-2-C-methyl-D-erythritol kinase